MNTVNTQRCTECAPLVSLFQTCVKIYYGVEVEMYVFNLYNFEGFKIETEEGFHWIQSTLTEQFE